MKKLIPILAVLIGITAYVYFARIRPGRVFDPTVRGSGSIEALTVVVAAKIPARILTLKPAEGDHVKAGDVLATLQCDEPEARLAQAQATLAQAEAGRAQAQVAIEQVRLQGGSLTVQQQHALREYDRAQNLLKSAGATQRTVDQAETAKKTADEQVRAAAMSVDVARRAEKVAEAQVIVAEKNLALSQTQVAECTLVSPMDGVVMARVHEPGELVLPGSTLLKLGRMDELFTWIYVPNEEVGKVALGQPVTLTADTYPNRQFAGTVARINDQAEFTPKSIQTKDDRTRLVFGVKVVIPNTDGALLPGMPVEAELPPLTPTKG